MMKSKFLVILVVIGIIFISGCVGPATEQKPARTTQPEAGAPTSPTAQEKIATTITPARDLTGEWQGRGTWRDNIANPACSFGGSFRISLKQSGNALTGTIATTFEKATQLIQSKSVPSGMCDIFLGARPAVSLTGQLSGALFEFTANDFPTFYKGSFTTDNMQGTFESCPGQKCQNIPAALSGYKGDFVFNRIR